MASPTKRSPRVQMAAPYARQARGSRRPQHRFSLVTKPFEIQPFAIAPVLPGETLKMGMIQSQVWTDPLKTLKNLGWWCEYHLFYVKHRDLMGYETTADGLGDAMVNMFLTNASLASFVDADGNIPTYCPPGGVDFTLSALRRIVEEYFRDEGEAWDVAKSTEGVPFAKIYGKGSSDWSEKLTPAGDYEDRRQNLDVDGDGEIYTNEVDRAYVEWAAMRDAGLMAMDYEDWLRAYGGSAVVGNVDRVDYHRPEDMAYFREFTYPTNTVEPTTGIPAVAAGWRVASRVNKAYAFPEPGWVIGLNVVRPKVYLGKQQGSIASMMQTRLSWIPPQLNDQLNVSHLLVPQDTGPLAATFTAEDYWIDLRDLLNYGDQFVNYAITDIAPFVDAPLATGSRRYPTEADAMAFFSNTINGRIRQDGVLSLTILGRQKEQYKNLVLGQA